MKRISLAVCLTVMAAFVATSAWAYPVSYTAPIDSILWKGTSSPSDAGEKLIFATHLGISVAELDAQYIYTKDESMSPLDIKDYRSPGFNSSIVGAWDYALVKVDGPNDYSYLFMDDNSTLNLANGDDILTTPNQGVAPFNTGNDGKGYGISHVSFLSSHAVPEPATMLLLGVGLIGLAGYSRKRFKSN